MMHIIGNIGEREVHYFDIQEQPEWIECLPETGWILLAIANLNQNELINQVAKICMDKNVSYACGAGSGGSLVDDSFDMEYIIRRIANNESLDKESDFEDAPMTTWHEKLDEGFWFASTNAYHETIATDVLVCLNLSPTSLKEELTGLINKINDGWLPSD